MSKDEALRLALEALEDLGNHDRVCPQWPTYAEPENYPKCNCGYDQAITAIKAALEAKDEPVAWSEDFDAMPFNTYCKAIVDWYSHSRDGDSFLEGRDVEVIIVKYESGEDEYDTVFIHEGNKQYAYTRCEVSKWKPLYAHPFKE